MGGLAVALMAAFVALESRIANPIVPFRILRLRGLVNASLVRGFLVTGMYSTFFLGTLYLEHVRHYSALQTGAAFLPWTLTVAVLSQGVTARLVGALRAAAHPRGRAWRAPPPACSCSRPWGRTPRTSRRSSSPASRSGSGSAMAFMPLLTLAMADVPAADAGLGSGITNVSQQISGALGLAVLSTVAANHTKGLLADDQASAELLIGGYHVAFLAGAVTIAAGIVARVRAPAAARAALAELQLAEPRPAPRPTLAMEEKPHDPHDPRHPRRLRGRRRVLHPRHLVPPRAPATAGRARGGVAPPEHPAARHYSGDVELHCEVDKGHPGGVRFRAAPLTFATATQVTGEVPAQSRQPRSSAHPAG